MGTRRSCVIFPSGKPADTSAVIHWFIWQARSEISCCIITLLFQVCVAKRRAFLSYVFNDLSGSGGIGSVQDFAHQERLDRTPHNPCDRIGLQILHEVITERSWKRHEKHKQSSSSLCSYICSFSKCVYCWTFWSFAQNINQKTENDWVCFFLENLSSCLWWCTAL